MGRTPIVNVMQVKMSEADIEYINMGMDNKFF